MNISFVTAQTSAQFGTGISNLFDVHNKLVTYGINASNYVTLAFAGGGVVTIELQGFGATEATAGTNTFDLLLVVVLQTSVLHEQSQPSADHSLQNHSAENSNPLIRGGFFYCSR